MTPNICPHCKADMNGTSIWQTFYDKSRENGYYEDPGLPMNEEEAMAQADKIASYYGATRFSGNWQRQLGISSLERDRTDNWECPDCAGQWGRDGLIPGKKP